MVPAVSCSTTPTPKVSSRGLVQHNSKRPPLLPSEVGNGPRRPKSRQVTSPYLSSSSTSTSTTSSSGTSTSYSSSSNSTPRRFPSPIVSRTFSSTPAPMAIKRSQSVERRRPPTPRPSSPGNVGEILMASKLFVDSKRSLSISFQRESFSLPINKAKPAPAANLINARKGIPERSKVITPVRGRTENSKPVDQQIWPARSRQVNSLTRSVDFTNERTKLSGSESVVRTLQKSVTDEGRQVAIDAKLKPERLNIDANSDTRSIETSDHHPSDTESVSSGSTSRGNGANLREARAIIVPASFWQETNNRLRRAPEPGSPVSRNNGLRTMITPKFIGTKKLIDSTKASPQGVFPRRGESSPLPGYVGPASPRKDVRSSVASPRKMSPSRVRNEVVGKLGENQIVDGHQLRSSVSSPRGMTPSRIRSEVVSSLKSNLSNTPSFLSFAADVRRGKVGENRIVDAHQLRLLYNQHLQWRFVNARADAAMLVQKGSAEKSLYNAWLTTLRLRHSVRSKRIDLQLLRQHLKIYSILKGQIQYLDKWDLNDKDHSSSLSGAIEALESSTLRLPVVGGAIADIQILKDAICSAVDVMQAMASSICSLLTQAEHANSLMSELASITTNEHASLDQCIDLLSTRQAMQVKDCSLRTHMLQIRRVPSSVQA